MSFALFLGGSVMPVLLMLSPLAVMATSECDDWKPAAWTVRDKPAEPCARPRWPLM
ncbi:hypothetical protein J3E64_000724 [Sphingobium sp. OAS761]|uniref:hypothetical protein n=1 Tax=Sphingobium sp. OAS761 TaxID=2817901 RepID=UPI00209ED8D9|nr:hypothetical protein [Sphingobium sp. OAS761]MCP1469053.1 hypothetical protein [Sphingobium sp. OAS761]